MKEEYVWSELLDILKANARPLAWALVLGCAASLLTAPAQLVWQYTQVISQGGWFRDFGFPGVWLGIWKAAGGFSFSNMRFFFYASGFLESSFFWAAICFVSIFVHRALTQELPVRLLPAYLLALGSARIELEYQMAVAVFGSIMLYARIDPFSYAHIVTYFTMALLLFPAVVTLVSRLPFREIFRLSCLGLPIILMPPILDNYVLHRPLVYNFYSSEFFTQPVDPLRYLTVVSSTGIRLEAMLVATLTFVYLLYRTRSIIRSFAAVGAVVIAFIGVTTPVVTSRFHLVFSQPQFFAGFLILTYVLMIIDLGLAQPKMGSTIIRRMRIRGIHFPAMVIFGAFLVHPSILGTGILEDYGLVLAGGVIAFLVWQAATVFDDFHDRREMQHNSVYLSYGLLTASMAVLAAIPFGPVPWLLTLLAACLAVGYPALRRRHWVLSGLVIGASSCTAFLFGVSTPLNSPSSSEPLWPIALTIFVLFSGGSLLKDVANVEGDRRSGIRTIFTRFDANVVLPVVATFVAAGFVLPAVFLSDLLDLVLFLVMGVSVWVLILLMKSRSYKPVLLLYFLEGIWLFARLFLTRSG